MSDTFVLHIKRLAGFTMAGGSTKILIDGYPKTTMRVGASRDFVLPRKMTKVLLLTTVPMGKDIEKIVVIDPLDSPEMTLEFTYKMNMKALLPFGAFTQQQAFVEANVIRHKLPEQTAFASHPQAASNGERKFCTNCGKPNIKEAKFCAFCGNKFLE